MTRHRKTLPGPVWPFRIVAVGFFIAQIVVLEGAASAFRQPKEAVVLAAFCLAIALAVVGAARNRCIMLPRGRLAVVLLVYPALLAASALWSANPIRAFVSAALSAIWIVAILWISTLHPDRRRQMALITAIGAVISVSVMLLQVFGVAVFQFTGQFAIGRFRLSGLAGNPADLAMASVFLLPLLLTYAEDRRYRKLCGALAIVLSLAVLITQTLTGIAALAAVAGVWLIQHRSRKVWVGTLGVALVIIVIALAAGLDERVARETDRIRQGNWYQLFSARGDGWTAAAEMVRSRPIRGVGAANYTHLYYPSRVEFLARTGGTGRRNEVSSHFDWAHNDPFQLVAEIGVLGIIWALCLVWAIAGTWRRAGPLLPLAAASWVPFALLHYPTHLAVGLIPTALVLGHLIASDHDSRELTWSTARVPVAIVVVVIACIGVYWQLQRTAANLWMGALEMRLMQAAQSAPETAARQAAAVEAQILQRIEGLPYQAPVLWRTVGRSRIVRSDWPGAEQALRNAHKLWPHEESALYLGISLAAQGRRSEGLQFLGQVCRTNPELVTLISDPNLRRTVEDMLEAYRLR